MQIYKDDGALFDPEVDEIGWQIIDADGNVVESGPIVIAEMTDELAEAIGPDLGE